MRRFRLIVRLVPFLLLAATAFHVAACGDSTSPGRSCCKVCREGKACGDTCISKTDVCHTSGGCACNGLAVGA